MDVSKNTVILLAAVCLVLIIILRAISMRKQKNQLTSAFKAVLIILITYIICLLLQIYCVNKFNANPMYFDYMIYTIGVFLPVAFLFVALIYAKTKIVFKKKYILLFIIPIISVILTWTNEWHHLFFKKYSTIMSENELGPWFTVHTIYTYLLDIVALFTLVRYSIKNSGFFSKPALLILLGALIPIAINALGGFGIIEISLYTTPVSFAFTTVCLFLVFFRFNILKNTPIALQTIVDRISDSYVILNDDYEVTDYNETFVKTFKIKDPR